MAIDSKTYFGNFSEQTLSFPAVATHRIFFLQRQYKSTKAHAEGNVSPNNLLQIFVQQMAEASLIFPIRQAFPVCSTVKKRGKGTKATDGEGGG